MKSLKKLALYLVFFIVLGIVVFVERSFLYTNLVQPIVHVSWYVYQLISAIDQKIIWFILVFLAFITSLILLNRQQESEDRSAYTHTMQSKDRFTHWEELINEADLNASYRKTLEKSLGEIIHSINEPHIGQKESDVVLPMPNTNPWLAIWQKWSAVFRLNRTRFVDSAFQKNLDRVLESIESMTEKPNDKKSSHTEDR